MSLKKRELIPISAELVKNNKGLNYIAYVLNTSTESKKSFTLGKWWTIVGIAPAKAKSLLESIGNMKDGKRTLKKGL